MKVVIIDQEILTLKILGDFLQDLGHEVIGLQIEGGKLEPMGSDEPGVDLVIIDPGALNNKGQEIIREFHQRHAGADIVIMSYTKGVIPFINAMSHGVYAYLPKPVHLAELELLLTRVQERRQALSRSAKIEPDLKILLPEKTVEDE